MERDRVCDGAAAVCDNGGDEVMVDEVMVDEVMVVCIVSAALTACARNPAPVTISD